MLAVLPRPGVEGPGCVMEQDGPGEAGNNGKHKSSFP